MDRLKDKIAVITGGTSGIGLATARLFHAEGAHVVVAGRDRCALERTASELGGDATAIQADVSRVEDIDRLMHAVGTKHGGIDVLFINAGIAPFVAVEDVTEQHFDEVIGVNLKGAFFSVQRALPYLNEGASVLLTSSVVNTMGLPMASVYAASKAAVRSLARSLSAALAERQVRVNVLSPGLIETPLLAKTGLPKEMLEGFTERIVVQAPIGRVGRPEEMASIALFLASDESSYVVGSEFTADGGLTQV